MSLIEQKTLAHLGRPDYSFYLFSKNPFRTMPVVAQEPSFLTDRDQIFLELSKAIETSLYDQEMEPRMLIADYGMGKSHILKFIRHRINLDLRERPEGSAIAAYAIPGRSLFDLYTGVLQDLGEQFLLEVSLTISKTYSEVQPKPKFGQQYDIWSSTGGQTYYVPSYVSELLKLLPHDARKNIDRDYFAALIFLQNDRHRENALYWLQGGAPQKDKRDAMGISSIITRDTAANAFVTLITTVRMAGYSHFYLCLDEMEKLTYLTSKLQAEYFEHLRYVIDQLSKGFSIFGAVTPEAWQELERAQHAFQSRLRQFRPLELPPMALQDVLDLIRDYIAEERKVYTKGGEYPYEQIHKNLESLGAQIDASDQSTLELFPFSPSVVNAIGKQFKGNPRDILRACAWLIDLGRDQQRIFFNADGALELLGLQQRQEEAK